MIKKASIKTNFIYNLLYQVISLITPLITAPYVARVLGAEGVGVYNYTQSIVIYFSLIAGLGSNTHGRREIAASSGNQQNMTTVFYDIMTLRAMTVAFSILLFWGYIVFWGQNYKLFFMLQTIDLIAILFDISWFYQGIENFKKTALRQILVKIMGVSSILLFVKKTSDIHVYILCYSIPVLLGNLFLWIDLKGKISFSASKVIRPFRHLKSEIALFIPYLATLLYSYIDKTMLGIFDDTKAEVGYYAQAFKFIAIAVAVVSSLADVMVPRIANCYKQQKYDDISSLAYRALRVIFAMAFFIAGVLFSVSPNLIPWFLGDGYTRSILLLQILSLLVLVKGANNFLGSALLIATYHQNLLSKCAWLTTIVNVIINALLIPNIGAAGACIATVSSEILLFILQLYYTKEYVEIKTVLRIMLRYGIPMLGVIICVSAIQLSSSIISTIILGIISGFVYLIILLVMKDELGLEILGKIKSYLKKL